MLLTELLTPSRVKIPLEAADKPALLDQLIELVSNADAVHDLQEVRRSVQEREEVLSTGIGNGVAIPHGKSAGVDRLTLAAGVTRTPIDFAALDGRPVTLFFLLVGPETEPGQHVKALSRISRLLRKESFRQRLSAATDGEDFYRILEEAERS